MTGWKKWTRDEINICLEDIPEEEVMERTGRTLEAVRTKRYQLMKHYKSKCERREDDTPISSQPEIMTEQDKINRIYLLAEKLGVKLQNAK